MLYTLKSNRRLHIERTWRVYHQNTYQQQFIWRVHTITPAHPDKLIANPHSSNQYAMLGGNVFSFEF